MRRPARGLLAPQNRAVSLAVTATMALTVPAALRLYASYNPDRFTRD